MKTLLSALNLGLRQSTAQPRLLILYYLCSAVLAGLIALPFSIVLNEYVGHSLLGGTVASKPDPAFLLEFLSQRPGAATLLRSTAFWISAFSWLLALFLSGGTLEVLFRKTGFRAAHFCVGCARFFGPFLRILLWSLSAVLCIVLCLMLVGILERVLFGTDPHQSVSFWTTMIQVGIVVVGVWIWSLIFELSRISSVVSDDLSSTRSFLRAIRFTRSRLFVTGAVALVLTLVSGVAGGLCLVLVEQLAQWNTTAGLLCLVLVQQGYVLFRIYLRITRYAAQMEVYRSWAGDGASS